MLFVIAYFAINLLLHAGLASKQTQATMGKNINININMNMTD